MRWHGPSSFGPFLGLRAGAWRHKARASSYVPPACNFRRLRCTFCACHRWITRAERHYDQMWSYTRQDDLFLRERTLLPVFAGKSSFSGRPVALIPLLSKTARAFSTSIRCSAAHSQTPQNAALRPSPKSVSRYSTLGGITGCTPDPKRVCTSHVERQNLTMRMSMRRLTRLTNAFSKKWENLWAAYCLHFAYYNFCRIHKTLRVTPAMEAGLTDHIWELADLLA